MRKLSIMTFLSHSREHRSYENGEPASDDVYLYRYHDDDEEPELEYIDNDEELDAASDYFDEWLDEQSFLDSDE